MVILALSSEARLCNPHGRKASVSSVNADTACLAEILGPWADTDCNSGLVERCKHAWTKPLRDLSRAELAMLLRQRIAVEQLSSIAKKILEDGIDDDTEIYAGELESA